VRENGLLQRSVSQTFAFAQTTQQLGLTWLEPDPLRRLPAVWDVLREAPPCTDREQRIVLALILGRIARAFFEAERVLAPTLAARSRRDSVGYLHALRAVEEIRREFANPRLGLSELASICRLSEAYLSNLVCSHTRYGCRSHLRWIRILHSMFLLGTTALFVEEIASARGFVTVLLSTESFADDSQ
jgi:AraC-like DNA-binding protein